MANSRQPLARRVKTSSKQPARQYRYGEKRTWEIVLDAVQSFSRPVSAVEIGKHIATPDFALANVTTPIFPCYTVNSYAHGRLYRGIASLDVADPGATMIG